MDIHGLGEAAGSRMATFNQSRHLFDFESSDAVGGLFASQNLVEPPADSYSVEMNAWHAIASVLLADREVLRTSVRWFTHHDTS